MSPTDESKLHQRGSRGFAASSAGTDRASVVTLILRLVVGTVLCYAGFSKAIGPTAEFAAALAAYKLLPTSIIPTIAMIWPWAELLTGTYLLFGFETRLFAAIAAGMFAIFSAVLGTTLARGIDPGSCGCFGISTRLSVHQTFGLDLLLLCLALALTFTARKPSPYSADNWIRS
jgi:uncharacterized membrane protein YphA (DoxX/SURF4 family)